MDIQIELSFSKKFGITHIRGNFSFGGGFNVILGASGSGKTTLLRVMCGLEKPDEGHMRCCQEVFFDTERGIYLPPQRRRLGIVFQEENLLPHLNVRENIEFALKKAPEGIVSLEELIERFALKGLEDKKPSQLSGGERQRVAIIRALAYNPRALLMDEPFSSLDFKIKMSIISFLKELELDIPVVMVTHDPFEAISLADRVFIMDKGRKVAQGNKELVYEFFKDMESLFQFPSSL